MGMAEIAVRRIQVNGSDVRAVRGSVAQCLLGKVVAQRITAIDLDGSDIGGRGAAEAVAAMLFWSSSTLTTLNLG